MVADWTTAQSAVIGAGLRDGKCVPEILAEMRAEDFNAQYRRYYEAFAKLSAGNGFIDPVSVVNELGPAYAELTMELFRLTPTAANVSAYIGVCKEQARLSLLRECGAALSGAATLDEAREALRRADGVSLESGRKTGYTAAECVTEWYGAASAGEPLDYIRAGLPFLDDTLMVTPGNYVVLAGYTSHGKTALAAQMAMEIAKARRVGFFSYEMSRQELTERMIARAARISYRRIQSRKLTREEWQAAARAASEISALSLKIEEFRGRNAEDVRSKTLHEGYEAVFVDYLQYMPGMDWRWDDFRRVSDNSMRLAALAQQGDKRAVYCLSQLSRADKDTSKKKFVPPPKLSSLRQSGQIEQDANAVVFVHAPYFYERPGFRMINVAKNRKNRPEEFFATFDGKLQSFRPPTTREGDEYVRLMRNRSTAAARDDWSEPEDAPEAPVEEFGQEALPL